MRKPLVILRKVTQGRNARSEPLFVAGMARLVTKTNMWRRIFLITRWNAGRVGWRAAHEFVEAGFEARGIGFERHVRELVSPSANPAGSTKQMVQTGCENAVAGVDGILHGRE